MNNIFFRKESLDHQRAQLHGSVLLATPPSITMMAGVLALLATAVGAWLYLGEYARKANVSGQLTPEHGDLRVYAPSAGVVLEQRVHEGEAVAPGQLLFVIGGDRESASRGATLALSSESLALRRTHIEQEIARLREVSMTQRRDALRRQAALREEMRQAENETALSRERTRLAEQSLAKYRELRVGGFVSELDLQQKQAAVLELRTAVAGTARNQATLARELSSIDNELDTLPLRTETQASELTRELAALAQAQAETESQRRFVVTAPSAGTVSAISAMVGKHASPDTALATILPADSRLEAQLFTPSQSVGFVRVGQPVWLRYQSFPYQKFGQQRGTVVEVSTAAIEPAALGLPQQAEPLYRLRVRLDRETVMAYGKAQALKPGMRLEASVELDRRRIYEWLFEPLISIGKRV